MKIEMKTLASGKIRGKMKEKRVTSKIICDLLRKDFEVSLSDKAFNNKLSNATFSATFFFQCMYVLGVKFIDFDIDSVQTKEKTAEEETIYTEDERQKQI